jgi:thiol-disulfide isomerase/thioredoxin
MVWAVPVLMSYVTGGLIALAAALVLATAVGLVMRRRSGQFRSAPAKARSTPAKTGEPGSVPIMPHSTPIRLDAIPVPGQGGSASVHPADAAAETTADPAPANVLTEADLGVGLGERATLVQFSTAFCAPCRPTRQILAHVAETVHGVRHVEIDATTRLDLVRRLRIASTPTILVLGPDGAVGKRATGLPRKADVFAALGQVIGPDHSTSSIGLIDNTGNGTGGVPMDFGSDSPGETE